MTNENVIIAIEDMKLHLKQLPYCNDHRKKEIHKDASVCDQLMNYSDLVADKNDHWKKLEQLVQKVMVESQ